MNVDALLFLGVKLCIVKTPSKLKTAPTFFRDEVLGLCVQSVEQVLQHSERVIRTYTLQHGTQSCSLRLSPGVTAC